MDGKRWMSREGGWTGRSRPRVGVSFVVLGVAVLWACGSDATAPVPELEVASVVVSGTPTTAFLVGDSVQLFATAVNTTGGVITYVQFTWSSTAPTVVAVRPSGMALALGAGVTTVSAKAKEVEGTTTLTVSDGGSIGTQGGTLVAGDGAVVLEVPPGSLQQTTFLLARPAGNQLADARLVPGTVWEWGPGGVTFAYGAKYTAKYDPADVPSGLYPQSLQIHIQDGTTWVPVSGSTVDTVAHTVTATIRNGGVFAVRSTPVGRIEIAGAVSEGALFTGQTAQLAAALYAEPGDSLPWQPVQWASSAPAVATVDADGGITAVAEGSATITASTEGKEARTTVVVLARPIPSWNHDADWVTFQGNASHTGFVDAVLDPSTFEHVWTSDAQPDGRLSPPAIAEGKVFFTNIGRIQNALVALDARTGQTLWLQEHGPIHTLDAPAYGNGTVFVQTGGHEDSFLWAYDAKSGQLRFQSRYSNQWSGYYAPTVVGRTVYMAGGYYGGMYAFDAVDGDQVWFRDLNQYDQFTPAVEDGRVYAYTGEYSPAVTVADAATGEVEFEIPDPNFDWNGWSMNIAPVLGGSDDLLATQAGRLISFDLAARSIRWERRESYRGTVTVADGTLYVFNNTSVEARSQNDGSHLWTWSPPGDKPAYNAIVTRNLLFVTDGKATWAVDLDSHRTVWSYPVGGPLAMGRDGRLLIVGSDGTVTAIDVR